ncbi:MAG: DUF1549 domain-containing protein, partial [Planctomycetota bacterium]
MSSRTLSLRILSFRMIATASAKWCVRTTAIVTLVGCVMSVGNAFAEETPGESSWQSVPKYEGDHLFTLKILPLLKEKCQGCHGADEEFLDGELNVLSLESLLRGGESEEPAIVPGEPDKGMLIPSISWEYNEMPPKENDRLTEEQVQYFRDWIAQGAPWPSEAVQTEIREEAIKQKVTDEGMIVETSGGTSAEWTTRRYKPEDLWAFLPVEPTEETLPENTAPHEAIDFFINEQLEQADVTAASAASPEELIRRASYDLTGLPPTPEEIEAFVEASGKDADAAWAALIDRLLDSPRYGEHWARHWLDITRYADTGGMSNDYERSNMWRYRDYVVRSFNADKPYNEFVVEQLAGDELADESYQQRTGATAKEVHQA